MYDPFGAMKINWIEKHLERAIFGLFVDLEWNDPTGIIVYCSITGKKHFQLSK